MLILAGDKQNLFLYKKLRSIKYPVDIYGFDLLDVKCKRILDPSIYDKIITSIPFTINNNTINSPFSEKSIYIDDFIKRLSTDTKVIGGPFPFIDKRFIDITKNKEFIKKSIIPTCEEIIKLLIEHSEITIFKSKIQIIGTGLLSNELHNYLEKLGAYLTKESPDIIINCDSDLNELSSLINNINKKNTLIIDISNNEKIIDKRVVKARGLAVKSAPISMAKYLFETLTEIKFL